MLWVLVLNIKRMRISRGFTYSTSWDVSTSQRDVIGRKEEEMGVIIVKQVSVRERESVRE
jgi:hypothetical protein